jgi:FMN-dependent NADH-azoreductase
MKTLLKIQSSLFTEQGQSTQLADRIALQWQERNPGGRIVTRDLGKSPVPHLTADRFTAFLAKPAERTLEQQAIVDFSDELIQELRDADVIVIGAPMYNFSIPSTLRAYFDHIARSGITFQYTAKGPEGLIKGKKTYVVVTRGGVYESNIDTQTSYLRQFLSFVGLDDVEFVYAEGLALGAEAQERSLNAARHTIATLLPANAVAA